eukprot:Gb_30719 [translate_table: standard]
MVRVPFKYAGIPEYARVLIEALKKNRLCQKVLRSKVIQIETKVEENKELKNRVKCLVDFQAACKRRLGQLLTQDSDPSVKLISRSKCRVSSAKLKESADDRVVCKFFGPPENSDVAKYKMVQKSFPTTVEKKKWSKKECVNLGNGIKQQVQETLVRHAMDLLISQENLEDASLLDEEISAISQTEISAEDIRTFLPEVDWERLASTYVAGHSGADCEARWLNDEDPLINHGPWTKDEDKKLLIIVQNNGLHNWVHISNVLGSNRTPAQCLSRYQRSLNAHIMRKEWTEEEDEQLRAVVEAFGENDWQIVAANMEGRTGAQCLNRWCKSIHPDRKKVGRWKVEEDKRLKLAVMVYGPRTWKKIAAFVPGRTEVQCRERWCNVLDPSLKLDEWTEEEDTKLKEAISLYGYCWSKVAIFVPPRTDNQCRRRWKILHPQELAAAQKAGKIRKTALISNFVGRKKERPTIGPSDFIPEQEGGSSSEAMITSTNVDGEEEPSNLPRKKRGRPPRIKDSCVTKRKRIRCAVGQGEPVKFSEAFGQLASKRTRSSCEKIPMKATTLLEGHHSERRHREENFESHSDGMPIVSKRGEVPSCGNIDKRVKGKKSKSVQKKKIVNQKMDDGNIDKKVKGRKSKSVQKKKIVNLKMDDRGTTHFVTSVALEEESIQLASANLRTDRLHSVSDNLGEAEESFRAITNQGGSMPLRCSTSDKRGTRKQTKSRCKATSVQRKRGDPDKVQLTVPILKESVNSDFVAITEGDEARSSCFKSEKRQKAKHTKLKKKARIVNQKKEDHEKRQVMIPTVPEDESIQFGRVDVIICKSILNTHAQNANSSLIGSEEIPLDGIKSDKRVKEKQTESVEIGMSASHKSTNLGTMELMMPSIAQHVNLHGMPVLSAEDEDVPACCVKVDKQVKVKHNELIQEDRIANWKKDDQGKIQILMPAVPNNENCAEVDFRNARLEMPNTRSQMDGVSSAVSDKGGNISLGCEISDKRLKGNQTKSANKVGDAQCNGDDQEIMQRTMNTATEHDRLDWMPVISGETVEVPSCRFKSEKTMKVNQSNSLPKPKTSHQKKDNPGKRQFAMPCIPLARAHSTSEKFETISDTEGKINDDSCAFDSMVEAVADCCRCNRHLNAEEALALPAEPEFHSCQVHDTGIESGQATIQTSTGNETMGFQLPDSSSQLHTEADIGGKDDEAVVLATKAILSWPFYFSLQDILREKREEMKYHGHSSEERLENIWKLVGDVQQTDGLVSATCRRSIERLENGQNKNQMLPLPNENIMLKKDKESEGWTKRETNIKENINEQVEEQADDLQLRRSKRATRSHINYKELLKGNIRTHPHKT